VKVMAVNVTNTNSTHKVVLCANGGVSDEDQRIRTFPINSIVSRKIASLASWMPSSQSIILIWTGSTTYRYMPCVDNI